MKVTYSETINVTELDFWPFQPNGPVSRHLGLRMTPAQAADLARTLRDELAELGISLDQMEPVL